MVQSYEQKSEPPSDSEFFFEIESEKHEKYDLRVKQTDIVSGVTLSVDTRTGQKYLIKPRKSFAVSYFCSTFAPVFAKAAPTHREKCAAICWTCVLKPEKFQPTREHGDNCAPGTGVECVAIFFR